MSAFFNIGSILLGLAAWALPLARKRPAAGLSFALCAGALLLQLLEVRNRVNLRDFAAIDDTIGALTFAAAVLVTITVALNIGAFLLRRHKGK